jgi:hypothetical protein
MSPIERASIPAPQPSSCPPASPHCSLAPAVPAHAAATVRAEACSGKTDSRSSDNKASADWKICLQASSWTHGTLSMHCWGGAVFWSRTTCGVSGGFDISKDGHVVKRGSFSGSSDTEGAVVIAQPFTFTCQGPGNYTFTIHRHARVTGFGSASREVYLPEKSVSSQGC